MGSMQDSEPAPLLTGIVGLDDVLRGGLSPNCVYLVSGSPGAGKTTLALQFLIEGARAGESCLYVTLSKPARSTVSPAATAGTYPALLSSSW